MQKNNEELLQKLDEIRTRCAESTPGPWRAYLESRENFSGSDFIMTKSEDIYLSGASKADYDFIAEAKQDIPFLLSAVDELLSEIVRLRSANNFKSNADL